MPPEQPAACVLLILIHSTHTVCLSRTGAAFESSRGLYSPAQRMTVIVTLLSRVGMSWGRSHGVCGTHCCVSVPGTRSGIYWTLKDIDWFNEGSSSQRNKTRKRSKVQINTRKGKNG